MKSDALVLLARTFNWGCLQLGVVVSGDMAFEAPPAVQPLSHPASKCHIRSDDTGRVYAVEERPLWDGGKLS